MILFVELFSYLSALFLISSWYLSAQAGGPNADGSVTPWQRAGEPMFASCLRVSPF
jgi:hypothetical protein